MGIPCGSDDAVKSVGTPAERALSRSFTNPLDHSTETFVAAFYFD